MEWISVQDKLPEDGQVVLTCNTVTDKTAEHSQMFTFSRESGFWGKGLSHWHVTHWMEMPKLPAPSRYYFGKTLREFADFFLLNN